MKHSKQTDNQASSADEKSRADDQQCSTSKDKDISST